MKKLLLAGIASLALVSAADADVQIKMKPGAQCWSYQGYDTRFYGDFAGGQALTVAFVFQEINDHGGITTTAYNGDRVWVNGPDEFYLDGNREPAPTDPFMKWHNSSNLLPNLCFEEGLKCQPARWLRLHLTAI
jgi:hypothetical protein